jgi:tetratricopeptide (TPR) repeat protein
MTRWFGVALLCVAVAACGGKDKKEPTTPAKKTDGNQSMNDTGDPGGGGTQVAGGGSADAGGGGGGMGTPAGGGTTPDPAAPPPVVPPNYDVDPAQAKAQVDAHLVTAKAALARTPPDPDAALASARQALKLDAASVDAASMVAFAYYHKKLNDTAELVLDDLFKREAAKQNANVYYVYGLVYDATNRPDRAALAYRKAVDLNPNHASALVNLGVHQLQNAQYAEAQGTFERLTQQFNRTDAVTLTSLGSAYRGRSAEYPTGAPEREQYVRTAEQAYKRAQQSNPNYGPAYYNTGLLYLDNDPYPGISDTMLRLQTAKSFFDQYKNMPGFDIKLYDARMKDVDKAIKRYEKQKKKEERERKQREKEQKKSGGGGGAGTP